MKDVRPLVLGLDGFRLTAEEKAFLREAPPMAFLLFARNVDSPDQVRALCDELAEFTPFEKPLIAVDQEGGRVQRVKFGGKLPAARAFGEWYATHPEHALEATRLSAFLLAAQLRDVGANWLMGPLIDVGTPSTHTIIGNRAFAEDAQTVITLATEYAKGVEQGGCLRCLKHAPGHGRAVVDSHFELPEVTATRAELEQDFAPFKAMAPKEDFLMTAHIRFTALDNKPATYSSDILTMMREDWNFGGLILADDVGMKALPGNYTDRVRTSLAAGCDVAITALSVLKHGMAGTFFDTESFAALCREDLPALSAENLAYMSALSIPTAPSAEDVATARERLAQLWADAPVRMSYSLEL
ncbi:MAG: beta-N-acetylhexosaminidase [Blastochloris viridis]|uniref:beta-N-acetylhexosaminidase n=1 Tax=Blastochloris viridis TaxID=1079 RepID=A0A6N4RC66_BLAVI|nr:MAG: beta-N-acetylhexosaminidase [Blastochloris viridis]